MPIANGAALVEAWIDAVDRHDLDAIAALFASQARFTLSAPMFGTQLFLGATGVRSFYAQLFAQVPRLHSRLHDVVAAEGRVMAEYEWAGPEANGNLVWHPTALSATVAEGRIVDMRFYRADPDAGESAAG